MSFRRASLTPVMLAALAVGLALGGCGAAQRPGGPIRGRTLTIYFSGPLHGASSPGAVAALRGAQLALGEVRGRLGGYRIELKALDDSTPQSQGWDPSQTTRNARTAIQDPTTIGYLGEFNSGASAISIPQLNRLDIAQISPASTAVGLTSDGPGASPGEPQKYYPTGVPTFARVIPSDIVEAGALVHVQQQMGCRSTFVLQDGEFDGEDTALTFVLSAQAAALRVVGVQAFQRQAGSYSSLAASVAGSGADCVLISAIDEASAVLLTEQLARKLPQATIFASGELADSAYTDPARGGVPTSIEPRVIVVSAALDPAAYPTSGQAFLASYSRRFGAPEPPAIFGYAAMKLMLAAISSATDRGREQAVRSKVVAAIHSARPVRSPLGKFRIDSAGDTTIERYGIYRIVDGRLSFLEASG